MSAVGCACAAQRIYAAHLFSVVSKAGYLEGIEEKIASQSGNAVSFLEAKKQKLEQKVALSEKRMKALIRLQVDSDGDPALRDLYANELKELKAAKDADLKLLSQVGSQLLEAPSAKAQCQSIQSRLNEFHAAWDKAPVPLRKRLLRGTLQRLVFHPDSIDLLYHTDSLAESVDRERGVDVRAPKSKTPLGGPSDNGKFQGGYIANNGSGGRI